MIFKNKKKSKKDFQHRPEYKLYSEEEYQQFIANRKNALIFNALFMTIGTRIFGRQSAFKKILNIGDLEYLKLRTYHKLKMQKSPLQLTKEELKSKWEYESIMLSSESDVSIKAIYIKTWIKNSNNDKWFVLVHGINNHKQNSFIYALIFLRAGYNVVIFDLRNHGESSKAFTTLGFKESLDLKAVIEHLKSSYVCKEINFFGWSMGSFTILHYLQSNNLDYSNIKYMILDAPINNIESLWKRVFEDRISMPFFENFHLWERFVCKKTGYRLTELNLDKGLEKLKKIKSLYILNKQDAITYYDLGLKAFQSKIWFEKHQHSIHIDFDSNHCKGIVDFTDDYVKNVYDFINFKGVKKIAKK